MLRIGGCRDRQSLLSLLDVGKWGLQDQAGPLSSWCIPYSRSMVSWLQGDTRVSSLDQAQFPPYTLQEPVDTEVNLATDHDRPAVAFTSHSI